MSLRAAGDGTLASFHVDSWVLVTHGMEKAAGWWKVKALVQCMASRLGRCVASRTDNGFSTDLGVCTQSTNCFPSRIIYCPRVLHSLDFCIPLTSAFP